MTLSETVTEAKVAGLRRAILLGHFPGITFEQAMEFLLTDGLFPESGLPVESFLKLSAWARNGGATESAPA
ncbi:MAG TPA: hypothetical protein VF395_02740 [Polyangiaceae bacterium]